MKQTSKTTRLSKRDARLVSTFKRDCARLKYGVVSAHVYRNKIVVVRDITRTETRMLIRACEEIMKFKDATSVELSA